MKYKSILFVQFIEFYFEISSVLCFILIMSKNKRLDFSPIAHRYSKFSKVYSSLPYKGFDVAI